MEAKKKVTIDRGTWRCGGPFSVLDVDPASDCMHGKGSTSLLNPEGFRCCLGFAAAQLGGVSDDELLDADDPSQLDVCIEPLNDDDGLTNFSAKAMRVNDNETTTRVQKEQLLLELFEEAGIELKFVGEYRPNPPAQTAA